MKKKHQLVIDFKEKPFETWSGPKQFWNLLPSFLQRIKNDDPKWSQWFTCSSKR